MIYSIKNRDVLKDLEELAELQSKVQQVRLCKKFGKQSFHHDTKDLFEPITKAVTDTSQKIFEGTRSKTKAIEELDESNVHGKVLEFMKKKWNNRFKLDYTHSKTLSTNK